LDLVESVHGNLGYSIGGTFDLYSGDR
jgi:hypothetical protein